MFVGKGAMSVADLGVSGASKAIGKPSKKGIASRMAGLFHSRRIFPKKHTPPKEGWIVQEAESPQHPPPPPPSTL